MGGSDVSDNTIYWLTGLRFSQSLDIVIHIGDISYADCNEVLDDDFMRKIEPVSAYIPYMTIPGNHEAFFNFAAYRNRWRMPVQGDNLWYSYDYGPIHFLAMNTEMNNDLPGSFPPGSPQYEFVVNDLKAAVVNRGVIPWIVVLSHRPFYCKAGGRDCTEIAGKFRGWLEDIFNEYHVDLVIGAHRHDYERSFPVYNVTNIDRSYDSPKYPVYVVNGAAGNQEHNDGNTNNPPNWLAYQSPSYGYSLFTANLTSMTWNFYGSDSNTLIDSFTINK